MRQLCRIKILVVTIVALSCSMATGGEEDVLEALERIKAAIEDGASREELAPLLDNAKMHIDRLQRGDVRKDCFRAATRRSHYWYDLGVKSWGALMENQKKRDRYRRKAEYGEYDMREISQKMADNYDKLIRHAQDALPSNWAHGNAALDRARECSDLK
ncbi:MAG: hypothetical protein SWE60_08770 [Thermodesulfobacteriota bacterium]|nr:hypothetical protein [Thermodesulfobacteriota bacterium]